MIDQKKRAYHFETSSLLPLKLVLSEAEKESPPQGRKEQKDTNEELALKLIASMKKNYKKLDVVARATVRSNPLFKKDELASPAAQRFVRKDIKVEP